MASLDDILTTAKNLVTAVSNLAQAYLSVQGTRRSAYITGTSPVLVTTGQGRLVNVSVMSSGSGGATGEIYDTASTTALNNQLGNIVSVNGVYNWNIPFQYGLVVVNGSSSMTTVVTYSLA